MPTMTKTAFLAAFEAKLKENYKWAQDADRLARFMGRVSDVLAGKGNEWVVDGSACRDAWHEIGGKGRPTLKSLCELPND